MDDFEAAKERYTKILPAATTIRSMPYWSDLRRMAKHCVKLLDEISKESVVCRQRQSVTAKYTTLVKDYTESVDVLEKYVMLAHLSGA
jgi:hypothetical protein